MELKRFELLTSAVQGQRSPRLSYNPKMNLLLLYNILIFFIQFIRITVPVGFEPTTYALTVRYSTAELWNNN